MYRTLKTPFRASYTTIGQLFDIRRLSGTIWND
ncbi:transposase, partial [Niallia endozanthoxylica]